MSRLRKRQNRPRKLGPLELQSFCDYIWTTKATVPQACKMFAYSGNCVFQFRTCQLIREDRSRGGRLYMVLDNPGAMRRFPRHKTGKRVEDGRKGIDECPFAPESTDEYGHWDVDTVHSARHVGEVATTVERKTLRYFAAKVADLCSRTVCTALTSALAGDKALTVKSDNGPEFASWKEVEKELGRQLYFARPHSLTFILEEKLIICYPNIKKVKYEANYINHGIINRYSYGRLFPW